MCIIDIYVHTSTVPSGPPIYVRSQPINPAGLHISWGRPKLLDCNGDIIQYIIVVDGGSDVHNYTFNVSSHCVSRMCTIIECMSHSFTISEVNQLISHKKYSVKIAAVNFNGTGPFSNAIEVMSGDDGKGQLYINTNHYINVCTHEHMCMLQ